LLLCRTLGSARPVRGSVVLSLLTQLSHKKSHKNLTMRAETERKIISLILHSVPLDTV
jgi:hypothetical protein